MKRSKGERETKNSELTPLLEREIIPRNYCSNTAFTNRDQLASQSSDVYFFEKKFLQKVRRIGYDVDQQFT